jgi:hypothetical protein
MASQTLSQGALVVWETGLKGHYYLHSIFYVYCTLHRTRELHLYNLGNGNEGQSRAALALSVRVVCLTVRINFSGPPPLARKRILRKRNPTTLKSQSKV